MVDLRPDQLATVNAILLAEVPDYEIWAFGSRAQWTAKDSSDLDLAIVSESPLPFSRISHLREAFEQSYLPFTVDVVDLANVSSAFRALIDKQHVVIRKPEPNGAKPHRSARRSLPLEEAVETIIDYRGKTPKKVDSGIPLITAKIIKNGKIDTPTEFISPDDYDGWMRRGLPQAGDVLLTMEAPLGEVAQLETGKVALAQRLVALRGKKNLLDNDFLKYLLQSREVQDQLKSRASGTTVQGIKQSELRKINLSLPPLDEQRVIANVLGMLDKKIEMNRRMNETLEAMAQALFKSWFVDATHNDLPDGWRKARLWDCCESIFSGGTPNTQVSRYWGGDIPWLSSGETRRKFIITTEKTITPEGVGNSSTRLARRGATVIASAGQGHTRGQTSFLTFDTYINQSVVALVPNQTVLSDIFLFFDLGRRYEQLRQLSDSHSSRGSLTTKLLGDLTIALPPRDLISNFDQTVKPVMDRIVASVNESRTLAALRDALLPQLLSGRLTVRTL